jgi:hypothetical protein
MNDSWHWQRAFISFKARKYGGKKAFLKIIFSRACGPTRKFQGRVQALVAARNMERVSANIQARPASAAGKICRDIPIKS